MRDTDTEVVERYLAQLPSSPHAKKQCRSRLRHWRNFIASRGRGVLEVAEIDFHDFKRGLMATGATAKAVDPAIAAVNRFYAWAYIEGLVQADYSRAVRTKRHPRRDPPTPDEIERLVEVADNNVAHRRAELDGADGALRSLANALVARLAVLLLAELGCQVGELLQIQLGDIDRRHEHIRLGRGTERERSRPMSRRCLTAFLEYERFFRQGAGSEERLFKVPGGTGPMSFVTLSRAIRELIADADLPRKLDARTISRFLPRAFAPITSPTVIREIAARRTLQAVARDRATVTFDEMRSALETYHPLARLRLPDLEAGRDPSSS